MFEPIEGILRDTVGYRGMVDDVDTGIEIHRNNSNHVVRNYADSDDLRHYYVRIAQGGEHITFALTEKEMLSMFEAFAAVHDDIERIKNG